MTQNPSYAFLGTPAFSNSILEGLVNNNLCPSAIFTQPAKKSGRGQKTTSCPVAILGQHLKIETHEIENMNAPENLRKLQELQPDYIVVVAFGQFLGPQVLNLPKVGCFNIHGSLLPKYRGAGPVQWSIYHGESETGVSLQKMVKKMDAGDVVLSRTLPITSQDTTKSLLDKMVAPSVDLISELLQSAPQTLTYTPQDESQVSFAPLITKDDSYIDWNRTAQEIDRQVRAFTPWPQTRAFFSGTEYKVIKVEVNPELSQRTPLIQTKDSLEVRCGDGTFLSIKEIQAPNKKPMKIKDFLNGINHSHLKITKRPS